MSLKKRQLRTLFLLILMVGAAAAGVYFMHQWRKTHVRSYVPDTTFRPAVTEIRPAATPEAQMQGQSGNAASVSVSVNTIPPSVQYAADAVILSNTPVPVTSAPLSAAVQDVTENPQAQAAPAVTAQAAAAGVGEGMQKRLPAESEALTRIYTTHRGTAFTFSGAGSDAELNQVLEVLAAHQGHATFFMSQDEITENANKVREIVNAGHAVGLLWTPARESRDQIREVLRSVGNYLAEYCGYRGGLCVRLARGAVSDNLMKACADEGCVLVSQLIQGVPEQSVYETNPEKILVEVFGEADTKLQMGEIVHFQMGFFQRSETILADYLDLLVSRRCIYALETLPTLLLDEESRYVYPVPDSAIAPELLNAIHPGHLAGKDTFEEIKNRYIGISWVNNIGFLPGFTNQEIYQLDRKGLLDTNRNQVFLTFDDWGTDGTIDKLLKVLEKHNARGTFFVKTQAVPYNPNLLRAIAEAGHSIGSHTNMHIPLSVEITGIKYQQLSDESLPSLRSDLEKCHDVLQHTVGDVKVNGRNALTLLFRPPTMAVGRNSLEVVFDEGFTYSVSGYFTTQDYSATSAETLYRNMKQHVRNGAILVMHMSDVSVYTAEALDMLLTDFDGKYEFIGLGEVLQ